MLIKKGLVWIAICLLLIPLAYASGLLTEVKPGDLRAKSRGLYRLASMIVGCEMDNKCMQMTLTEVIKTDPHPIYEDYLNQLNQHKSQIEYEQAHCNTAEIRTYRRELSGCLMTMLQSIDPKKGISEEEKSKVENKLYGCIVEKMTSAAKQGNIYAQAAMMDRALKNKDEKAFNHWYNAIQRQQTTLEYSTYRACETPLEMFQLLPSTPKASQQ